MKNVLKKLISSCLILCLLFTTVPTAVMTSSAATTKTKDQAIAWLDSLVGKKVGDGECVALIHAYYNYLGAPISSGDACDYATNSLPSGMGWERKKGATPQKGDILIWTQGYNNLGHVAICGGTNKYYHQNWAGGQYVQIQASSYTSGLPVRNGVYANYWGVIRPKFGSYAPLVTPTITFDKSSYTKGDTITVSWKASPSNSNLSHYWITITDSAGKKHINEGIKSKASFTFSTPGVGTYKVKVYATPIGSESGEGSLTDTKSITVNAAKTCKITYNANGGNLGSVPTSQTYTYSTAGGKISLTNNKPIRAGYTFLGWSLSKTATTASYLAGHRWGLANYGNYTMYAVWKKNSYSVTLQPTGGKINGSSSEIVKSYNYGSKITLPDCTREGYSFLGWAAKATATTPAYPGCGSYTVDENIVLYAVWKKNCTHTYSNPCDTSCNLCSKPRTTAHNYTSATCKAPKTCKLCGKTSGNKISHKYDSGKVTKKATCKQTGIKTYTCTACKSTKTKTIAKTKHTYKNNVCKTCGSWDKSSIKKKEKINKKKYYVITKSAKVYTGPYKKCETVNKLKKGEIIVVTQRLYNADGEKWFKYSDGYINSESIKRKK